MKKLTAVLLLMSGISFAAEGPKLFIESISQPHPVDSLIFRGHTTTDGKMKPASEIERMLTKMCAECSFVTKQEKADYILTFSNPDLIEWSVADNAGDGKRIGSGKQGFVSSPYVKALEAVRKDWAKKNSR